MKGILPAFLRNDSLAKTESIQGSVLDKGQSPIHEIRIMAVATGLLQPGGGIAPSLHGTGGYSKKVN